MSLVHKYHCAISPGVTAPGVTAPGAMAPRGTLRSKNQLSRAGFELKHRRALKPPLEDIPEESPADYYSERAQEPGTVVVTEDPFESGSAAPAKRAAGHQGEWQQMFRRIHEQKSYAFVQLSGAGKQLEQVSAVRSGPVVSEIDLARQKILQMSFTEREIKQYVHTYFQAAKDSVLAGADGVEVHGASGCLLDNFLDPRTNHRSDEYGGSIPNRARFVLQVLDAVIDAVGASRVGVCLSPYGSFGQMSASEKTAIICQYAYLVGQLERRAVLGKRLAYIHLDEPCPACTGSGSDEGRCKYTDGTVNFVYSIWRGPVIRAGNMALTRRLVWNFGLWR